VGGSTGSTSKSTTDDFAGDVLAGVAFLKTRPEIDARMIGLMGHSEGGIIAPLVASRSKDVAFIVLLAGTGLPGDEIINLQARAIGLAMSEKSNEPKLLRQLDLQKRLLQVLRNEPDDKKVDAKLKALIAEFKATASESDRKEVGDLEATVASQSATLHSPWFRYFLTYDPRPALTKVHCPVLAVIGEKDLQVPPKENLAEIGKALKQGGNTHATLKQFPGLNHLFQTCKTGAPAEYAQIEETIAPLALKEIGDWVVSQTSAK
jgi:pimeloyl-ACP methyl ester carboxylesterase